MKIAFIVRFHYKKNEPKFEWRLDYFKKRILPRLKNQGVELDICVWCNEWHDQIFKDLGLKIFRPVKERAEHREGYWLDFVPWKDIRGLDRYDIQMGIDSDDLIDKNYVKTVLKIIEKESKGRPMHICFQPQLFDWKRHQFRSIGIVYGPRKGSAFFAIYQPVETTKKYIFAYEDSHLRLWKYFEKSVIIPSGRCWATVHGLNESTKLRK